MAIQKIFADREYVDAQINAIPDPIIVEEVTESVYVLESSDIDTTLSVAGKVADAKVVGNKIDLIFEEISKINRDDIIQDVIAALGTPVYGRVDADKNIYLTGELVDGTYKLFFEGKNGKIMELCTMEHDASESELQLTWNEGYVIDTNTESANFGKRSANAKYAVSDLLDLQDGYAYTVGAENWSAGTSCYAIWYTATGGIIKSGSISNGDGWSNNANGSISFVLNPPEGAEMFCLQSYCGSSFAQLSKVTVKATADSTKKYSTIPLTWYEGTKLSKNTGAIEATGTNYNASEFISVESGKTYGIHASVSIYHNCSLVFYDSDRNFVSYVADVIGITPAVTNYEFTPPTGAAYLRIRQYTQNYTDGNGAYAAIWRYKLIWLTESE